MYKGSTVIGSAAEIIARRYMWILVAISKIEMRPLILDTSGTHAFRSHRAPWKSGEAFQGMAPHARQS